MKKRARLPTLLLLAATLAGGAVAVRAQGGSYDLDVQDDFVPAFQAPRPTHEMRRVLFDELRFIPPWFLTNTGTASQDDFDVLQYDISLVLDIIEKEVRGRCAVTLTSEVPLLDEVVLDFHDVTMRARAVTLEGVGDVPFTHANNLLTIPLDPPLAEGAGPITLVVDYEGAPLTLSRGTLTFETQGSVDIPIVFSFSEPFLARAWFPCKDRPDDRAALIMRVEAPEWMQVVSNGMEAGIVPSPGLPDHLITTWRENYPIATYLVSVAASEYVTWEQRYRSRDGRTLMPVKFWSYESRYEAAREDWNVTVPMLEFFADSFGEYPFLEEKYAHAMVNLFGAMENQTATSMGSAVVTGTHEYDFLIAHELAHQWWGNDVGIDSFDSLWLKEGLATYSEALWHEHDQGPVEYLLYMRDLDLRRFQGTVDEPPDDDGDGWPDDAVVPTVYNKGAWVFHMLRGVLQWAQQRDDAEPMMEILRAYRELYRGSVVRTADFEQVVTDLADDPLYPPLDEWFFEQWLRREGRPLYGVGWSAAPQRDGGYVIHVRIEQQQAGAPYVMPVTVRLELPGGETIEQVVWNEEQVQLLEFDVSEVPESVSWDPDGWVLKDVVAIEVDADEDGWPDWFDSCPEVPDPEQTDSDSDGLGDACQAGIDFDADGTPNEEDCAPADADVWSQPIDDVFLTVIRQSEPDGTTLRFSLPAPGLQRPYLANVTAGVLSDLREDRSTIASACLESGIAGDEFLDQLTNLPDVYYVVHARNGCQGPRDRPNGQAAFDPCQ